MFFTKEPDDKIRHHAIADDFTFIFANLISIHLYVYIFYIVIEKLT